MINIGVDLDNVLLDLGPSLIAFHNKFYKTTWKMSDFDCYEDLWNKWWQNGKDPNKGKQYYNSEYCLIVDPMPGAVEGINQLCEKTITNGKKKYNPSIVTARPDYNADRTNVLVSRYFPNKFSTIHHAGYFDGTSITKAEILHRENIGILIDDCLEYLQECDHTITKIWFNSYKRKVQLPSGIQETGSWDEIIKLL